MEIIMKAYNEVVMHVQHLLCSMRKSTDSLAETDLGWYKD